MSKNEAIPEDGTTPENNSSSTFENLSVQEQAEIVHWDDPRETRNPRNWTTASRLYHTIVPGLSAFLV